MMRPPHMMGAPMGQPLGMGMGMGGMPMVNSAPAVRAPPPEPRASYPVPSDVRPAKRSRTEESKDKLIDEKEYLSTHQVCFLHVVSLTSDLEAGHLSLRCCCRRRRCQVWS